MKVIVISQEDVDRIDEILSEVLEILWDLE